MYGLTNHVNKHHIQTDSKLSKNIKSGPCDQRIKTVEMYGTTHPHWQQRLKVAF